MILYRIPLALDINAGRTTGTSKRKLINKYQRIVSDGSMYYGGPGSSAETNDLAAKIWTDISKTMCPEAIDGGGDTHGFIPSSSSARCPDLSPGATSHGRLPCPAFFPEDLREPLFRCVAKSKKLRLSVV